MNLLDSGTVHGYLRPVMLNQPGPAKSRGFLLDGGRCLENRDYYRKFVDFAADREITTILWHFADDQGCAIRFDTVPASASPHAFTKDEMRQLVAYAAGRGIEIIPELASLGHTGYLTRLDQYRHLSENSTESEFSGMCPVSPETRSLIQSLIEETTELFPGKNFHVGMDEVNIGGHPLTKTALQTRTKAQLLGDYIQFLHGVVTGKGKRMWMWGDMLLKNPTILPMVPTDVVIGNWQYHPDAKPTTTQTFLDAGLDVMLCSALISSNQMLYPGDQYALPNVRALQAHESLTGRGKVLGHIATIWTGVRFIADSLWPSLDLAAAMMSTMEAIDPIEQTCKFSQEFFSMHCEAGSPFAKATTILMKDSPLRKEWLAVAKLQPLDAKLLPKVKEASGAFAQAVDLLAVALPEVHTHLREFQAFSLLIEMLAHCYKTAVYVAVGDLSDSATRSLIDQGQSIVDRVDQTWDRERYADDPRKYVAPVPVFQDDHLIPVLRIGLDALKKKLRQPATTQELHPAGAK